MKHIYIIRRHRLAPDHFQGAHRKVPAFAKEYEVVFATSEVEIANKRKVELECGFHMNRTPFKYSIGRVLIT